MFLSVDKKGLIVFFSCFVLIIAVAVLSFSNLGSAIMTGTSANTNWGLGFHQEGEPPTGNASSEFLKKYNSYFIGDTTKKTLYITFDAGYENGYTPAILDALKKHNVKATFFIVGSYIKMNPELVKRMVEEGHIVGNHTQSHPNMSKMGTMESFKKEICPVEEQYKSLIGTDMLKFYRPPQGIYSELNLQMANELGYKTVFWSLAYVDWYVDKQPTKEQAFEKLMPRVHPGAIILLHSTSKTNSEILDEFLTKLEQQGYTFGTLTDL